MTDQELRENFKSLIQRAMLYAEHSHEFIFDKSIDDSAAVAYLNIAASKFSAAAALYYSCLDIYECNDAVKIFQLFDVYMHEFLSNYRTNHSHQWTDSEFLRLKEVFDYSAFAYESK